MPNSLRARINKLAYQGKLSRADADRIREALDKQIPKKPIWEDGHCYCPHKHKSAIKGVGYWTIGAGQPYCDFCGQRIDWSEVE